MNICPYWEEYAKYVTKEDESYSEPVQICNGTKEREECSCGGDVTKCNFYLEKRKDKKIMNTAEMYFDDYFDNYGDLSTWDFDDFMELNWEVWENIMTKSEAEAKFHIKIVA